MKHSPLVRTLPGLLMRPVMHRKPLKMHDSRAVLVVPKFSFLVRLLSSVRGEFVTDPDGYRAR